MPALHPRRVLSVVPFRAGPRPPRPPQEERLAAALLGAARAVADLTTTAEGIEREAVRAVAVVTARAEAAEARAASLESALRSARRWRGVGWGIALALGACAVWR